MKDAFGALRVPKASFMGEHCSKQSAGQMMPRAWNAALTVFAAPLPYSAFAAFTVSRAAAAIEVSGA
jgi:hypothetical protein